MRDFFLLALACLAEVEDRRRRLASAPPDCRASRPLKNDAIIYWNFVLRRKYVESNYCELCRPACSSRSFTSISNKTQTQKPTMTCREYTTICLLRWMKQFEMILICNMCTCTCNMRTGLSLKLAETLTKLFFKSFNDEYRYTDD